MLNTRPQARSKGLNRAHQAAGKVALQASADAARTSQVVRRMAPWMLTMMHPKTPCQSQERAQKVSICHTESYSSSSQTLCELIRCNVASTSP